MNKLDEDYLALCLDIKRNGYFKADRTGTGSTCVYKRQIRHKMSDGFPLLTTKQVDFDGIAVELLWFLSGNTNIQPLVQQGINIWNGDCFKNYLKWNPESKLNKRDFRERIKTDNLFAQAWGELGPIYGKQWREWDTFYKYEPTNSHEVLYRKGKPIDQINQVIDTLKNNPESRRILVNAWNVADIDDMVLPPCHLGFGFDARKLTLDEQIEWSHNNKVIEGETTQHVPEYELSLGWTQRSVDVPLGLPYNIASYGLLLLMVCKEVNMIPGELIGDLGNTHIYNNQFEGIEEQLKREPYKLPIVTLKEPSGVLIADKKLTDYRLEDLVLTNYEHHPYIPFPLSN